MAEEGEGILMAGGLGGNCDGLFTWICQRVRWTLGLFALQHPTSALVPGPSGSPQGTAASSQVSSGVCPRSAESSSPPQTAPHTGPVLWLLACGFSASPSRLVTSCPSRSPLSPSGLLWSALAPVVWWPSLQSLMSIAILNKVHF